MFYIQENKEIWIAWYPGICLATSVLFHFLHDSRVAGIGSLPLSCPLEGYYWKLAEDQKSPEGLSRYKHRGILQTTYERLCIYRVQPGNSSRWKWIACCAVSKQSSPRKTLLRGSENFGPDTCLSDLFLRQSYLNFREFLMFIEV